MRRFFAFLAAIAISITASFADDISYTEITKQALTSTFYISVQYHDDNTDEDKWTSGTGFLITKNGIVITAAHILRDWYRQSNKWKSTDQITLNLGSIGKKPSYHIKDIADADINFDDDIAVLKLKTPGPYTFDKVCARSEMDTGAHLFAYGFPQGGDFAPKEIEFNNDHADEGRWQVSGDLDHGMSGGPVFDQTGAVVAIVAGGVTPITKIVTPIKWLIELLPKDIPVNEACEKISSPPPEKCFPYSTNVDAPDANMQARECFPGRLVYVKWQDLAVYPPHDEFTGRYPTNLANRSVSLLRDDVDGTGLWAEQNLLRVKNGRTYWSNLENPGWMEIISNSDKIVDGINGTLLRRQSPKDCDVLTNQKILLETFFPDDLAKRLADGTGWRMVYRWAHFSCANPIPLQIEHDGGPFNIDVGPVVAAKFDKSW